LGAGSNVFNVDTNLLGRARDYGQVNFFTDTGSLKMRAADGVGRAALLIAPSSGTSYHGNQWVDLGGHYADLLLSTLMVGEDSRGINVSALPEAPYSSNYFGFDNGILDTTGMRLGNPRLTRRSGSTRPTWVAAPSASAPMASSWASAVAARRLPAH